MGGALLFEKGRGRVTHGFFFLAPYFMVPQHPPPLPLPQGSRTREGWLSVPTVIPSGFNRTPSPLLFSPPQSFAFPPVSLLCSAVFFLCNPPLIGNLFQKVGEPQFFERSHHFPQDFLQGLLRFFWEFFNLFRPPPALSARNPPSSPSVSNENTKYLGHRKLFVQTLYRDNNKVSKVGMLPILKFL